MKKGKMWLVWGVFMTLFYLGIACLLFFSDVFEMKQIFRIALAILFSAYGVFRGYRVWRSNQE